MEQLQRVGGVAGYVGAILLALSVLIGYNAPGGATATFNNPAAVLTFIGQHRWLWRAITISGILASGFAVVFALGLWSRLRDGAPAQAAVFLAFGLIGLAGYALSNWIVWRGGITMASYAARDQVAATQAWLALRFAAVGASGVAGGFIGAAQAIAGWATITTGVMRPAVGWLGVIAGLVSLVIALLQFLPLPDWDSLAMAVLTVIWLAWAGSELRRR